MSFIEYNWGIAPMGNGSADAMAGSILSMFEFHRYNPPLFLDSVTGEPVGYGR